MRSLLSVLTIILFTHSRAESEPYFSSSDNQIRIFLKITNENGEHELTQEFYDSLLHTTSSTVDQFFCHIALAWYFRNNNTEETTREIISAKTILSKNPDLDSYKGFLYLTEGKTYRYFGKLEKSLTLLDKATQSFLEARDLRMDLIARSQISLSLAELGRLSDAMINHSTALEKVKELDLTNPLNQQVELYVQSLYGGVLIFLFAQDKDSLDATAPYLKSLIDYATRLKHGYILSNAKGNLAYVYLRRKEYEKALDLARHDLNYSRKSGLIASTAHLYYMMAKIHFGLENMDSTSYYIKKTEENIPNFSEPILLREFSDLSLEYYEKIMDLSAAYSSLRSQLVSLDELYRKKSQTDFDLMKAQIDLEVVEQDLESLKIKNLIQNRMAILLIILLIVVTLLLAYIVRQSALQRMQNKQLETLNNTLEEEVQKRTQKIVEQNLRIKEIAFRNSHKTRAPVARLLGMVELLKIESTESKEEILEKIKESAKEIDEVIHEMNGILSEH